MLYAKTLAGKLNPDFKANLNGHPSNVIQSRSELGSKHYIFMENVKIVSLTKVLQHLLSAEILSEWKIEFILLYLRRNFQINVRNKLTAKCLLTFSHYTTPDLEHGSQAYVKNKLGSQFTLQFSFNNIPYSSKVCLWIASL